MDFISTGASDLAILNALKATGGILNGAKLALSTAAITPSKTTLRSELTAPTYTGYAQGTITWLSASIADDGTPELVGTVPEFRPTDAVTPNVIQACGVVTGADALIMSASFDNPISMASADNSLLLTVRVRNTPKGLAVIVS